PPGITDIPQSLTYQVAAGQFAGDYGLTVGGLRAEEAILAGRLATTTDLGQRIELFDALTNVRQQLAAAAVSISPQLQLAQAQARRTPGTLDDRAILQQLYDIAQARLSEAKTIEEQIALTNQLADLEDQLKNTRAEENQELISYLTSLRDIRRQF